MNRKKNHRSNGYDTKFQVVLFAIVNFFYESKQKLKLYAEFPINETKYIYVEIYLYYIRI